RGPDHRRRRRRTRARGASDDLRHGHGRARRARGARAGADRKFIEGSVNATLDALAMETEDVSIVGEGVQPIRHSLIARMGLELEDIETVASHPQATAQCARFIRPRLPGVRVLAGASTADAVRLVAEHDGPWAALGNRLAAERYGCQVLRAGVEDIP